MNYIPASLPPANSPYFRANSNLQIPLLYPNADPSGIVPNFGFDGVPNRAQGRRSGRTIANTLVS